MLKTIPILFLFKKWPLNSCRNTEAHKKKNPNVLYRVSMKKRNAAQFFAQEQF